MGTEILRLLVHRVRWGVHLRAAIVGCKVNAPLRKMRMRRKMWVNGRTADAGGSAAVVAGGKMMRGVERTVAVRTR